LRELAKEMALAFTIEWGYPYIVPSIGTEFLMIGPNDVATTLSTFFTDGL
jgi:hypothetical protein